MTASVITAIPAQLGRLLNPRRNAGWFAYCAAVAIQGLARGYSLPVIRWIIAQSALESAWGASTIARSYHNYTGMNKPSSRETVNVGSYSAFDGLRDVEYLKYSSPWQCAQDRFMWDAEFSESVLPHRRNIEGYSIAVAARYHASSGYAGAVADLLALHRKEITVAIAVPLAIVPLEVYLMTRLMIKK